MFLIVLCMLGCLEHIGAYKSILGLCLSFDFCYLHEFRVIICIFSILSRFDLGLVMMI